MDDLNFWIKNGSKISYDDYVGFGVANPLDSIHASGGIIIGNAVADVAGSIRWTGSDFEGYVNNSWKSLTYDGLTNDPSGGNTSSIEGLYADGNIELTGTLKKTTVLEGVDLIAQIVTNKEEITDIQDTLTFGIANGNAIKVDGTPVSGQFAKFTANGLVSDPNGGGGEWFKNTSTSTIHYDNYVGFGVATPLDSIHSSGAIIIGNSVANTEGSIRYTGSGGFEGYNGTTWRSFTSQLSSGSSSSNTSTIGGLFADGDIDHGIWEKGELIERLEIKVSKKNKKKKETKKVTKQEKIKTESSLPECEGSPLEVKRFSLTGGAFSAKLKMLSNLSPTKRQKNWLTMRT